MTHEAAECPVCNGPMFGVHCKLVCRNCGYREDCSDLFPVEDSARSVRPGAERGQADARPDEASS